MLEMITEAGSRLFCRHSSRSQKILDRLSQQNGMVESRESREVRRFSHFAMEVSGDILGLWIVPEFKLVRTCRIKERSGELMYMPNSLCFDVVNNSFVDSINSAQQGELDRMDEWNDHLTENEFYLWEYVPMGMISTIYALDC